MIQGMLAIWSPVPVNIHIDMNEDIKIDHFYATNNQEILLIKEATINTMCVPIET